MTPAEELTAAAFQIRNPFHLPGLKVGIDYELGLALADWLGAAARMAAAYPEMAHDHDRPACEDYACDVMGAALVVARQVLGTVAAPTTAPPVDTDLRDRRARYAAAIRAESSRVDDVAIADAVMAVADTEQAALRAEVENNGRYITRLDTDYDGLRTEWAALRAEVERLRTDRAGIVAEVLPAWEAMYEPGNVSDYLIGYANDQDAATGMAEAWMRSQSEVTGRLEWVAQERLATGRYDQWFELVQCHDDGIDTGPGIIVRRRMADEAQQPECAASTSGTCLAERQSESPCDTEASECVHGDEAQQPETEAHRSYRLEHRHLEEGTWRPNTPGIGANWSWQSREKADQRLAEVRDRWPGYEHRLIETTTTVTEIPAPSEEPTP
ncbi:hypothetical protein [Streptomyces sp. NPDC005780]|uniref:hypothetical protein n=1 Tax=Streptomyces sp. NPDC005780 TaxID=3364730 RepID=UPI003680E3EE